MVMEMLAGCAAYAAAMHGPPWDSDDEETTQHRDRRPSARLPRPTLRVISENPDVAAVSELGCHE
jgi:hypothetical protein